jgi:hypothetical protein
MLDADLSDSDRHSGVNGESESDPEVGSIQKSGGGRYPLAARSTRLVAILPRISEIKLDAEIQAPAIAPRSSVMPVARRIIRALSSDGL